MQGEGKEEVTKRNERRNEGNDDREKEKKGGENYKVYGEKRRRKISHLNA